MNICVIGLGRVGLPFALIICEKGGRVIGVDKNPEVIRKIRSKIPPFQEFRLEELLQKYCGKKGHFNVTNDLKKALLKSQVVVITIGTSINNENPDLTNILNLVNDISNAVENVQRKLLIFKTTVPIGTTRNLTKLIEERTGLRCGKDFFVAFCPARSLEGKAIVEIETLPKIIGGMDPESSKKAAVFFRNIGGKIIIVENPESAELIKLMDNAYRQTIFAFANDIALVAEKYGLNAYELIKAANDSYPRNNIPFPSAGVSGFCLKKDPFYLEASFKEIGKKRKFSSVWYYARKTNDYLPIHTVDLVEQQLAGNIKGANVLVCGICYKENVDDTRFSHGIEIAHELRRRSANVSIWDPVVSDRNPEYPMIDDPKEAFRNMDAAIFTVKHDEFLRLNDSDEIFVLVSRMRTPVIVDGWGIFQKLRDKDSTRYIGVGIK